MTAVHKKHVEKKPEEKETPVIVADTVTETTERIEVVEEVAPQQTKPDPLAGFKEKMQEEEKPLSENVPPKNFMWPILFIFVIALVLLTGIFLYRQDKNKSEKISITPSLSPTPTLAPAPTKTIDLAKYEIAILNGSGVAGEAGRQRDSLETEGFTISSIGNADNSDYTNTIIQAKKTVEKDFLDRLKSVLETSFTLGEVEELSEEASVPIIVTLGTKK